MSLTSLERSLLRGRMEASISALEGWLPIAVDAGTGEETSPPTVWWRHMGKTRLKGAFFQDDLALQAHHERRVCQTPLHQLPLQLVDGISTPSVFIFHVSRCGSTLLTQMLNQMQTAIVCSEPPVLDSFFRLHHHAPLRSGGAASLRALVTALGQRRVGDERHLVIKLDAWHLPWATWLHALYPHTPFVLLYREPEAILASHRRQRGLHMVPDLIDLPRLPLITHDLSAGDLDGYGQRVLDALFQAAAALVPQLPSMHLLHLKQLPHAIDTLLPHWGLKPTPTEHEAMHTRGNFHSKHGHQVFTGDPAPTVLASSIHTKKMDDSPAVHAYHQLERWRLSATASVA
uniref:Sulfotransferase family protein n=1 Tax=uncultured bacterium A1Q1_fos_500 TaxID=1256579 RepID=L7VX93_9BACT|nr:hypothetical protein [uncultured bacterium A1Q1_fos_500]